MKGVSIITTILFCFLIKDEAKKIMQIDKFEVCERSPQDPMHIRKLSIIYLKDVGIVMNIDGFLERDLSPKVEIRFKPQKCLSKEALDTCEEMSTITPPNLCKLANMRHMGWDEVVERFEPPLRCPFKKGNYYGRNVTWNPTLFQLFPLEGVYWRVNASVYENNIFLATACFDFAVLVRQD